MRREVSYGIIPIKKIHNFWHVLLIQHAAGHWSFPKGHSESGETPQQTAERELFEETGIRVEEFLPFKPISEQYWFTWKGELIKKKVIYFPALVDGKVTLQQKEVSDYAWCTELEANELITFDQAKKVCHRAFEFLSLYCP